MSTFYDGDFDYGLGLLNPADGYAQGVGHFGANFGYQSAAGCMTGERAVVVVVVLVNGYVDDMVGLPKPLIMAALSE